MLALKFILAQLILFAFPSFSEIKNPDLLLGSWQLQSFSCEHGQTPDTEQPQNPFESLELAPTKTFQPGFKFNDTISIPLGLQVRCETLGQGSYSTLKNILHIRLKSLESPDCPGLVAAFNEDLKTNDLFSYEFELRDADTLLLFQSLVAGETDFRCGKLSRVIETWVRLKP